MNEDMRDLAHELDVEIRRLAMQIMDATGNAAHGRQLDWGTVGALKEISRQMYAVLAFATDSNEEDNDESPRQMAD